MHFPYLQIFSNKVPLKFEKYMKLLDIFGDIISKCPDIIRKNTPLPAHSLDSSRSIELKLLVNHYETPCSISSFLYLGVTRKNLDRNLKIWARFQDLKILWDWDFASHWQAKNCYNSLDFEDRGLKFCMQA